MNNQPDGNAAAYYRLLHELVTHIGITESEQGAMEGICLICGQPQEWCACIMQEVMAALGCPSHPYEIDECYL